MIAFKYPPDLANGITSFQQQTVYILISDLNFTTAGIAVHTSMKFLSVVWFLSYLYISLANTISPVSATCYTDTVTYTLSSNVYQVCPTLECYNKETVKVNCDLPSTSLYTQTTSTTLTYSFSRKEYKVCPESECYRVGPTGLPQHNKPFDCNYPPSSLVLDPSAALYLTFTHTSLRSQLRAHYEVPSQCSPLPGSGPKCSSPFTLTHTVKGSPSTVTKTHSHTAIVTHTLIGSTSIRTVEVTRAPSTVTRTVIGSTHTRTQTHIHTVNNRPSTLTSTAIRLSTVTSTAIRYTNARPTTITKNHFHTQTRTVTRYNCYDDYVDKYDDMYYVEYDDKYNY